MRLDQGQQPGGVDVQITCRLSSFFQMSLDCRAHLLHVWLVRLTLQMFPPPPRKLDRVILRAHGQRVQVEARCTGCAQRGCQKGRFRFREQAEERCVQRQQIEQV